MATACGIWSNLPQPDLAQLLETSCKEIGSNLFVPRLSDQQTVDSKKSKYSIKEWLGENRWNMLDLKLLKSSSLSNPSSSTSEWSEILCYEPTRPLSVVNWRTTLLFGAVSLMPASNESNFLSHSSMKLTAEPYQNLNNSTSPFWQGSNLSQ